VQVRFSHDHFVTSFHLAAAPVFIVKRQMLLSFVSDVITCLQLQD